MLQALLLDFDGVILDSSRTKTKVFFEFFERFPSVAEHMKQYHLEHKGINRFQQFTYLSGLLDESPGFVDKCSEEFSRLVVERVLVTEFVGGAEQFLEYFSVKIPMHLVSNSPEAELMMVLEKRNLTHYFDSIMGSTATRNKVQSMQQTIELYNYDVSRLVYVGDTQGDYKAATLLNVAFFGLENELANFSDGAMTFDCLDKVKNEIAELI